MNLVTERLHLRPLSEADIEDIHLLNSTEGVARFNTIGIPGELKDTRKLLQPYFEEVGKEVRHRYSWVIQYGKTEEFMGEIGMNLAPQRYKMGKMYYNLLPEYWGKGYATEAVRTVLKFGFTALKLHRMEAGCAVGNIASIRVLEKVGMQMEAQRRKVLPLQQGWSDNYEFAILERDYFQAMENEKPIVVGQSFDVPAPVLWKAITDHGEMIGWYFDNIPAFEPNIGFKTQFNVVSNGRDFLHMWEVTQVIPGKKIAYSWKYPDYPGEGEASFEISEDGDQTHLTVTMVGIETFPQDIPEFTRESCRNGWNYFIKNRLKEYLQQ